ncbi:hypothetical protein [Streptomyces sp. NPDC091299]|uniref:hypothetical protein n=1 Tax=Streptomyces sp. NPDC091299 TaxID=3155302 RepID=UPI003418A5BB
MTLFTRQTARGRCPCGAEHAACGPPSDVTPIDIPDQEVAAVGGPLKKYRFTTEAGHDTVLKLNEEDAKLRGLGDDDLVDSTGGAADGEKAAPAAPNKMRTASSNKARAPRGKGGEGGGD